MKINLLSSLTISTCLLSACASQPENIATAYVSPLQYQDYSCKQIGMEMNSVARRASELQGTLKKKADNDAVQMGVGLVLLWPTLFALEGGDGAEAAEYSRLKGEYEALEKSAIAKTCSLGSVPKIVAPKVEVKKSEKAYN